MAKKESRVIITLVCADCKSHNYTTQKSKKNNPDKISLMKLCPKCGKHTSHNELKK
ncbi:MAG TPA: 50S ribosomal protein L33 [Patescibacteria group bacterium]|nr:50S ribosomal protein L33 [Patescibacteria group bacterium]